ncbi:MAG: insulinase family protein [Thermoanaerobaculia bacterium]|nr:insulinase family protein [Thermoanaerobaculia bacterium]
MRLRNVLLCLLPLALLATAVVAQDKIFPYDVHEEVLDNGLSVVVVPMDSGGLVAYWSIVRTGSRDEYEPGRSGFAHFFEHMMFRGTERFPADVYNGKVTEIGADANAFTSSDLTAYYLTIAAEDLETVVDLESDRFRNLAYKKGDFQTEAGAIYGEYRKNFANPFFQMNEKISEVAFTQHTYGHTTMGYEADIQAMPELYDYSLTFFERYYRPDNIVLLIVGDVEVNATMDLVRRYYADWEAGYVAPDVKPEPEQTEERSVDIEYPGASFPIIWLAYKGPAFDAADRMQAAGRVLCSLAFGETSEFYQRMVLDEQRVEFVDCSLGTSRDPGLINVIARLKSKDEAEIEAVIGEIGSTIDRFKETAPDAQRVTDLQSRLRYGFLMNLDTPSNVAGNLVRLLSVTGQFSSIETMYQTLAEVTPDDVKAAAGEFFVGERRTVGVLRGAK